MAGQHMAKERKGEDSEASTTTGHLQWRHHSRTAVVSRLEFVGSLLLLVRPGWRYHLSLLVLVVDLYQQLGHSKKALGIHIVYLRYIHIICIHIHTYTYNNEVHHKFISPRCILSSCPCKHLVGHTNF